MDPFIGEIRLLGFDFPPNGWAPCDGRVMPVSQYTPLFAVIGTTYGGDGRTSFALPDLRAKVPLGLGHGPGLSPRNLGESGGETAVSITESGLPPHRHELLTVPSGRNPSANTNDPVDNRVGSQGGSLFQEGAPNASLDPSCLLPAGGGRPHENRQPYLIMNFCIALTGIFPPRP
ncbi:tail fiber protein [Gammaproteobacteria bacterium AB-CW1]|uniref:Tail fiber protein n=1 Tax=Natronospira elongata TaxID=3110268 RepID=A0AAP6JH37_9GAMM|nr:tail fiber protein [Gammaproteobacteria bacterium AB-CW1]